MQKKCKWDELKFEFSRRLQVVLCLLVIVGVTLVVEPDLTRSLAPSARVANGFQAAFSNGSVSKSLAEMGQKIGSVASTMDYAIGIGLSILSAFSGEVKNAEQLNHFLTLHFYLRRSRRSRRASFFFVWDSNL